ncbi:MAG: 3-phosphoshikimate 1-carboxyvinyltransferase [Nitrososphaera sp.]
MVSVQVSRSSLKGSVRCPSSKSYSHRAIAVASLCPGKSTIQNALLARDTLATLAGCRSFGASITHSDTTVTVQGHERLDLPENVINAENSGTTIRILAAMSGLALPAGYTVLTGDESLRKRPMLPILQALNELGVEAFSTKMNGRPPLVIKGGGIRGGHAVIDGSISSQFISGLLIAGIYAEREIALDIAGNLVSRPYVLATIATMKRFGVSIDASDDLLHYKIKSGRYKPTSFEVPSDFSTAALLLAAGALVSESLVIEGLNFELPQGDAAIIDILQKMGSNLRVDRAKGRVSIEKSEKLEGGEFDLGDTPDLLPVVSVLALKSRSPVAIRGVAHARVKETDRVANIALELAKLGADVSEYPDGLSIKAPPTLRNASLEAYNDHRLFMAFTIASMLTDKSVVAGAESVDVSYPNFISDMHELGANISPMPDRE